ncbi:MAG: bifunctional 4-hydroxy-2-oxoglutarate aldolase/2-dehydro-3-deoxy-phosphogluconate aldolase [Cyclobacteriaceae bacterium]|jgi:2-dehydro-3-deoxyphosphogluconate aldolase/(4S)-4-hydroxy-2-oxoglutarate aldolase
MQPSEQKAMSPEIIEKIETTGVIAVLVIDEVKHAVPLARALLAGGVDAIELTLRTDAAMDAARAIKQEVPGIILGFGTVLTIDQIKAIAKIGADFAVAPGCNPKIISAAIDHGLSFAPGICTPTDIEMAIEQGCRVCKYFPAETAGGLKHLLNIAGPYQYLGMKFIPLGGLTLSNAENYLDSQIITAIGGSWIAKRTMIMAEDWVGITQNAKEIRALIDNKRKK